MTTKNLCETCGADLDLLKGMLEEPGKLETENHAIARIITGNCATCAESVPELAEVEQRLKIGL